jgi:hypothetical protein
VVDVEGCLARSFATLFFHEILLPNTYPFAMLKLLQVPWLFNKEVKKVGLSFKKIGDDV